MKATRMIGYLRVSTEDQDLGMDAQRAAITKEADHRGWDVTYVEDRASGKSLGRIGVGYALHMLDQGEADGIVVSRLDRLSRSVLDFATVLGRAEVAGWNVVVIEQGLDLSTPHGKFAANILMAAAEYERELIGMRTKEALAAARARGTRLGRPAQTPEHVVSRVVRERADGSTYQAIADGLNDDGVPTAGKAMTWTRGLVAALDKRATAA